MRMVVVEPITGSPCVLGKADACKQQCTPGLMAKVVLLCSNFCEDVTLRPQSFCAI